MVWHPFSWAPVSSSLVSLLRFRPKRKARGPTIPDVTAAVTRNVITVIPVLSEDSDGCEDKKTGTRHVSECGLYEGFSQRKFKQTKNTIHVSVQLCYLLCKASNSGVGGKPACCDITPLSSTQTLTHCSEALTANLAEWRQIQMRQ